MDQLTLIQKIAVWGLPVLFAITLHEAAHGWVASRLGDKTALMLGRVTLNPLKHIDPVGTILMPGILLMIGGFIFGWAKPVPVNWRNLNNPKRDMAIVALAGPMSNLLMALFWVGIIKLSPLVSQLSQAEAMGLVYMGQAGILINLVLGMLNLLPIPPLDGSRVLSSLLPPKMAYQYDKIEPFGFFIIIGMIAFGILPHLIGPPINFLYNLMLQLL